MVPASYSIAFTNGSRSFLFLTHRMAPMEAKLNDMGLCLLPGVILITSIYYVNNNGTLQALKVYVN